MYACMYGEAHFIIPEGMSDNVGHTGQLTQVIYAKIALAHLWRETLWTTKFNNGKNIFWRQHGC